MATRRKVLDDKVELRDLIVLYAGEKSMLDPLKKKVDKLNVEIKEQMQLLNLDELIAGDIRASISITPKEDFNEPQAIEILRTSLTPEQFAQCVKSREYLDDDAFEKLVFNDKIDAAILNPCRTPKDPTITLRIGKAK